MTRQELRTAIQEIREASGREPIRKLIIRKDILDEIEAEIGGELLPRVDGGTDIQIMGIEVEVVPVTSATRLVLATRSRRRRLTDEGWRETRYGG